MLNLASHDAYINLDEAMQLDNQKRKTESEVGKLV